MFFFWSNFWVKYDDETKSPKNIVKNELDKYFSQTDSF